MHVERLVHPLLGPRGGDPQGRHVGHADGRLLAELIAQHRARKRAQPVLVFRAQARMAEHRLCPAAEHTEMHLGIVKTEVRAVTRTHGQLLDV